MCWLPWPVGEGVYNRYTLYSYFAFTLTANIVAFFENYSTDCHLLKSRDFNPVGEGKQREKEIMGVVRARRCCPRIHQPHGFP